MPSEGLAVNEQRQRFIEDYGRGISTVSELADRFGLSRRTAHKWIRRHKSSRPLGSQRDGVSGEDPCVRGGRAHSLGHFAAPAFHP